VAVVGTTLYFSARDAGGGYELWKTDGTEVGTVRVRDIYAGTGSSSPASSLTVMGDTLYFSATDGDGGYELWKSDGTEAGTVRVKDINAGSRSSSPAYFTAVGGTLYFRANDSSGGTELWKSDGTEAGTARVKDIYAGTNASNPQYLTAVGGTLYFTAQDAAGGQELWKSDGSEAGTMRVKDIYAGAAGSSPSNLAAVGSTLYFVATDSSVDRELWKTDGSEAGTVQVADIGLAGSSSPSYLWVAGGGLFFTANDLFHGHELWVLPLSQAPIDVSLSSAAVTENQPAGALVGAFSTADPDPGDTFTYDLVSGDGDNDNDSFTIDADGDLLTAESFDYETKSSYSIRVRTSDPAGLTYEESLTIVVTDVDEDFGDAPALYATVASKNGPQHTIVPNGPYIGAAVDADSNGQPDANALGDDNAGTDDEDGVTLADLNFTIGTTPSVRVNVTNNSGTAATLYGWIDYNGDVQFDNATERSSVSVPSTGGQTVTLAFPTVPAGSAGNTFARFRLSTDAAAANPNGLALDGEVEDFHASDQ
jgi:ELWxxDGT repeat protein